MSFKTFVEEFNDIENSRSWLSPNGEFYPVSGNQRHQDWAKSNNSDMQVLFQQGWFRISSLKKIIYANNDICKQLNSLQKRNLLDFAVFNSFEKIILDINGKDFVLWVNHED